jgi:hypothetical protein
LCLSGCRSSLDDSGYTSGTHIQIDYSGVNNIVDKDWIEIDGVRFLHYEYMPAMEENVFSLPASILQRDTTIFEGRLKEDYTGIGIAMMLGKHLNSINKQPRYSVEHCYEYVITNRPLLMTRGLLNFQKADSSEIRIKTSPDYPARLVVLKE